MPFPSRTMERWTEPPCRPRATNAFSRSRVFGASPERSGVQTRPDLGAGSERATYRRHRQLFRSRGSLAARVRLLTQIEKATGLKLSLSTIFQAQTVVEMAADSRIRRPSPPGRLSCRSSLTVRGRPSSACMPGAPTVWNTAVSRVISIPISRSMRSRPRGSTANVLLMTAWKTWRPITFGRSVSFNRRVPTIWEAGPSGAMLPSRWHGSSEMAVKRSHSSRCSTPPIAGLVVRPVARRPWLGTWASSGGVCGFTWRSWATRASDRIPYFREKGGRCCDGLARSSRPRTPPSVFPEPCASCNPPTGARRSTSLRGLMTAP